jgi:nucleoid DNA-binding protein
MNRKILQAELIDLLTANKGNARKSNEAFVRGFFELIEEALLKDSFVKIKGFGTFKLVSVNERESVNINTGERYQISGHTKITFTPDNGLKELINKPFAHFETVILPESTTNEELEAIDEECKLMEEATNINEQEVSPNNNQVENQEKTKPNIEQNNVSETHSEKIETQTDENIILINCEENEEKHNENPKSDKQVLDQSDNKTNNDIIENRDLETIKPESQSNNQEEQTSEVFVNIETEEMQYKTTKTQKILYTLTTIILMVISYLAGYYKLISFNSQTLSYEKTLNSETYHNIEEDTTIINEPIDTAIIKKQLRQSFPDTLSVIRGLKAAEIDLLREGYQQVEVGSFYIIGTFKKHKLNVGETLLKLAKTTYGHKDYVKYIILYNNFKDPNTISLDTEIALPLLVEKDLEQ